MIIHGRKSQEAIRLRLKIADMYFREAQYSHALEELKDCLAVCTTRNYSELKSTVLSKMSLSSFEMGEPEGGIRFAQQSKSESK